MTTIRRGWDHARGGPTLEIEHDLPEPGSTISAAEYRRLQGLDPAGSDPGAAPASREQSEIELTIEVAEYLRACEIEAVWTHVANERRDRAEAVRSWRMGLLPGVTDLVFWLPNGGTLAIELKTQTGRQSPAQRDFEARLACYGHPYRICRSIAEVYAALREHGVVIREGAVAKARRLAG
jgi:hypothetical protein